MENVLTQARAYQTVIEPLPQNEKTRHFFAAVNGAGGFTSYFDDIFGKAHADRLYLLGGGPGSGKSTLLKRVAAEGETRGLLTERFHCSSSPYSLDGVLFPEMRIGILDATAPHTYLPQAAGVREITVDLGRAWDLGRLYENRNEIFYLSEKKKNEYKKAYLYLRAAYLLTLENDSLIAPYIRWEKLGKITESLCAKAIPKGNHGTRKIRIQRCASGNGNLYFETFSEQANLTYQIRDRYGVAKHFLRALALQAERRRADFLISYAPASEGEIDGLFFPESGVCFTVCTESGDKTVNCERFIDKSGVREVAQKIRFNNRSQKELLGEGYFALAMAGHYHDEIEERYRPCTDFSVTEELTDGICRQIFSR